MIRRTLSMLMLTCLLALGLQALFVYPVSAAKKVEKTPAPIPAETAILVTGPEKVQLSQPFVLEGTLKDRMGKIIPLKPITISANGVYLAQTSTKTDGTYKIEVNKDLPAGVYVVAAHFKGAHLLNPSTTYTQVEIMPAILRVQTVPAVPGVTFQVDGRLFMSDENGLATIEIHQTGLYRLNVLTNRYYNPTQRIDFGRWTQESYEPYIDIRIPGDEAIQVGLNVFHQVNQSFVDLEGNPINPQRITGILIKSAQGDIFKINEGQSTWIPASRTARRHTGLEETKLLYSVISVTIDGSSVVNQAQQKFYADQNATWPISLLLYSLRVEVKDVLFGTPVGEAVELEYPDKQIKIYPLGPLKTAEIHSLARGIYHLEVTGIDGLNTSIPVALSRNQKVSVAVVTYLDLMVVGSIGVIAALGLVLYGRPWLLGNLLKRKPQSTRELERVTFHEN
jgi:hypothetical protein